MNGIESQEKLSVIIRTPDDDCIKELSSDSISMQDKSVSCQTNEKWAKRRMSIVSKGSSGVDVDQKPSAAQMMRRRSTYRGAGNLTTMLNMRRMTKGRLSSINLDDVKPKVKMENTYKLGPDVGTAFRCSSVEKLARDTLESFLENEKYSTSSCNRLACEISQTINQKIKGLNFPRYRIVVNTIIGQRNNQSMQMASRCVWDDKTDTFCSVTYKNEFLFAIATIHAVYYD